MTVDDQQYLLSRDAASTVITIEWLPGSTCDLARAQRAVAQVEALGGDRIPLLVDMRRLDSMDRPARQYFMTHEERVCAVALLAASPATRMLANFFLGLKQSDLPVRMFGTEEAATAWLLEQT